MSSVSAGPGALPVLRRIREAPAPRPQPGSVCELCGSPLEDEHRHLVDLEGRNLMCACRGCSLLFTAQGSGGQRFRAVPDRYLAFPDLTLSPAQWDALQIPVSVAFFFVNSTIDHVAAFYPGPAGATESLLPLDTWATVVDGNPDLEALEPDVEALLVRVDPRTRRGEIFLVPIDACYELVGQLRRWWKGFDGGQEAHDALDAFFAGVRTRCAGASG